MAQLAAYTFDEASGNVLDVSGNGRDVSLGASDTIRTAAGGGQTYSGAYPNSKGLTKSGTGTDGPGPALTGMQPLNWSVVAWVLRTSNSQDGWIGEHKSSGSGNRGVLFLSGNAQARGRNAGGTVTGATAAQPTAGARYHIAATYDGTNLRLYYGGVLQATQALAGPINTSSTAIHFMDGVGSETTIDDLQWFDTALDATAITALMAGPPGSSGTTLNLGNATETDAASGAAMSKAVPLSATAETDTARSVTHTKASTVGPATETDTARGLTSSKLRGLAAPTETGSALGLTSSKLLTLGLATEADSAHQLVLGAASTLQLGVATETGTARGVTLLKQLLAGRATESDTARRIETSGPYTPVVQPVAVTRNTDGTATTRPADGTATTQETE